MNADPTPTLPVKVCCYGFCAYTHVTGKPCPRVSTATEKRGNK